MSKQTMYTESAGALPPFLRWAGGKQFLLTKLRPFLPPNIETKKYYEPFLGAGSLFFSTSTTSAVLSDANQHLINCYKAIRNRPHMVVRYLNEHKRHCNEKYYYKVRKAYNNERGCTIAHAARFIYLNRTSFNGVFRVNVNGYYNVPYGWKKTPKFPTPAHLHLASAKLKDATLVAQDYREALAKVERNSFIYIDPPYPALTETAYFAHYTKERFGQNDQESLAEKVNQLDKLGCQILITNADTPEIRELYKRFKKVKVPVRRYITCKALRHKVNELIIFNYEVER